MHLDNDPDQMDRSKTEKFSKIARKLLTTFVEHTAVALNNEMCLFSKHPSPNSYAESMNCVTAFESSSEHCDLSSDNESSGTDELGSTFSDITEDPNSPNIRENNQLHRTNNNQRFVCVFCQRIFETYGRAKRHYTKLLLRNNRVNSYVENWISDFLLFQITVQSTGDTHVYLTNCPVCQAVKSLPITVETPTRHGTDDDLHFMKHLCYYPYQCLQCHFRCFGLKSVKSHIQSAHPSIINYNKYVDFHLIPELEKLMDDFKVSSSLSSNNHKCCLPCSGDDWSDDFDSTLQSADESTIDDDEDSGYFFVDVGNERYKLRHCEVLVERLEREDYSGTQSLRSVGDSSEVELLLQEYETNDCAPFSEVRRNRKSLLTNKNRRVKTWRCTVDVVPLEREEIEKYCRDLNCSLYYSFAYRLTRNNDTVNISNELYNQMSLFDFDTTVPDEIFDLDSFEEFNDNGEQENNNSYSSICINGNNGIKKAKVLPIPAKKKKMKAISYTDNHSPPKRNSIESSFVYYKFSESAKLDFSPLSRRLLTNSNEKVITDELQRILERFLDGNESDSDDESSVKYEFRGENNEDNCEDSSDDASSCSLSSLDDVNSFANGGMSSSIENLNIDTNDEEEKSKCGKDSFLQINGISDSENNVLKTTL